MTTLTPASTKNPLADLVANLQLAPRQAGQSLPLLPLLLPAAALPGVRVARLGAREGARRRGRGERGRLGAARARQQPRRGGGALPVRRGDPRREAESRRQRELPGGAGDERGARRLVRRGGAL